MKLLQCLICNGELDIVGEEGYFKKVKCQVCDFSSSGKPEKKEPEVITRKAYNRGQ